MKLFKVPEGTKCLAAKQSNDKKSFTYVKNFRETTKDLYFKRENLLIDPVTIHNKNFKDEYIAAFAAVIKITENIDIAVFEKDGFLLIVQPKDVIAFT